MSLTTNLLAHPIFGNANIRGVFDERNIVDCMIRTEISLAQAQAEIGVLPGEAAQEIARLTAESIPVAALSEGIASAGVPVPALVTCMKEQLSPEGANWVHFAATSQDIVDTALCLCFKTALSLIGEALADTIDVLARQSDQHAETLMLARTRGQIATPITFGLRLAQWAQPLIALEAELPAVKRAALRVQFGGASGSRSALGDAGAEVGRLMARDLGLTDGPPWHTDRNGLRRLSGWLSRVTSATAKIGQDISLSARSEIGEMGVADGGGSSTMPHKSNPVVAEALQSIAVLSSTCETGLSHSATHREERDGAMWPLEWALLPTQLECAAAALEKTVTLVEAAQPSVDAMSGRIKNMPQVYAEASVFALADLVGREEAMRLIKEGLAKGAGFHDILFENGVADPQTTLDAAAFTKPAAEVARSIFSARQLEGRAG